MKATGSSTSIELETTRRRIARWRATRAYRGAAMPPALWSAAITLAQRHGLYTTARALHLDYGSLKTRVAGAGARRETARTFVELPPAPATGLGACVIELDARHGRRMRIEVAGVTMADLVTLTQAAWSGER
jgi:hypothetical protein